MRAKYPPAAITIQIHSGIHCLGCTPGRSGNTRARGRLESQDMGLEIREGEREGVTVLRLRGRITAGPESALLREKVAGANAAGRRNLVLDLAEVDYIDSTGLGALVMCATSLRKAGGGVKLLNLNKRNLELLVLTKLATVFDLFTDEQDAVNSFFPGRAIRAFDILSFVQQMKRED